MDKYVPIFVINCFPTSWWELPVSGFRSHKNDERYYHGYEGDEIAQTEADVLLYVSHAQERHKGTSIYEPVKPWGKEG
jgi:hypothetical protein